MKLNSIRTRDYVENGVLGVRKNKANQRAGIQNTEARRQKNRLRGYACFTKTKPISDARRDGEQGKRQKFKGKR